MAETTAHWPKAAAPTRTAPWPVVPAHEPPTAAVPPAESATSRWPAIVRPSSEAKSASWPAAPARPEGSTGAWDGQTAPVAVTPWPVSAGPERAGAESGRAGSPAAANWGGGRPDAWPPPVLGNLLADLNARDATAPARDRFQPHAEIHDLATFDPFAD